MTAILLILVLAFGLTACGGAKNNKENASGQTSESGKMPKKQQTCIKS